MVCLLDDGVFSLKLSSYCLRLGSRSSPSLRGRRRTPQLKLSVLSPCDILYKKII